MTVKKAGTKKKATRKVARRQRSKGVLAQWERDLPPNWKAFSRRVSSGLSALEREITRTQANPRREATRLLREASHALGRLEAEGERRWRKLTAPARREALRLLHRLESAIAAPNRRRARTR